MLIDITTEFIKLDSFLKIADLVASGGEAKVIIQDGYVRVNGDVEFRRGRKLYSGDHVLVKGREECIVKRI